MGEKGKRYSPRSQFSRWFSRYSRQIVTHSRARAHDLLHPTTVARWKREFLENGLAVFGKDTVIGNIAKIGARPVGLAMLIDEQLHLFGRRSSSACAKRAAPLGTMSFTCRRAQGSPAQAP